MGKIDLFEIVFSKPQTIYMGGDLLNGQLNIKTNEPLKINSIYINLSGTGRVRWTDRAAQASGDKRIKNVIYENFETYFNKQIIFLTKQEHSDLVIQGELTYPFEFQLPNNLPTSFQNKVGRIRYLVKGTIDIPWAIDDSTEKPFSVIYHYDLNMNPEAKQAVGATGQKVLCCGPCQSEPIAATFNLNKSGFVSGETVHFVGTIDNKSNKEIKYLMVKLIQQTKCYGTAKISMGLDNRARNKNRIDYREVATLTYDKRVPPKNFFTWDGSLKIPPICATARPQASPCKIIEITYYIQMIFDFSKAIHISTDLTIPIIIGTIPLKVVSKQKDGDAKEGGEPENSDDEVAMPTLPSLTYELDYEYLRAATALPKSKSDVADAEIDGEIEAEVEQENYKPLYPYYSFA